MDQDHEEKMPFQDVVAFMDGLHSHLKDYATLTLWLHNPVIRHMQCMPIDYLCLYQITFGNFQLSTSSVKIYLSEYSKKCFYLKIYKILNKMVPKLLYCSKNENKIAAK